ncbi:MAG: carbohydrate binding domain-containing protein, partial [Clostridia bacterium]|nr:carbohydrate binding domain-containing protein [Clostridia bacterium]
MKRKKIGALLCVCLLLCGIGIVVEASPYDFETIEAHTFVDKVNAQELVINGNFDIPESTTKPLGWGIHPGQFGVGNAGEYVWGDETYVKIQGIGTRLLHQPIKVENGSGKKCQMSARVKVPSEDVDIRLRAAFIVLQDGEEIELETVINVYFNDITPNVWTQKVIEFVLPENISKIDFSMRSFSVLAVSVDDISLLMEGVVEDEEMEEKPPVLSTDWEMIVNGGFDEVNIAAKTVTGWQAEPGANGTFDGRGANIQNDGDAQGNYIKVVSGATLPQIRQRISLLPGAEYRIIFKYKNPGMVSASFSCQMQYKRGGIGIELDGTKNMVAYYSSEWQDGFFDFTCPNEADGCNVSFRNHSVEGDICIDDVSLYMTKRPTRTLVETDERFYYTEWEKGYVTVEDRQTEGSLGNGKAVLTILDGQTPTIDMIESTLSEGRTTISFPTVSALPEKGKDYVAKVDIYAEGEEFIETQSFPIARFDRPTYLGADGVFRKPDRNGVVQERNISLGDSVPFTLLDKTGDEISDIGITVIQMGNDPLNRSILERMNAAEEAGLYVIVSLYYNKKSAGHPDMLDSTIKTVNLVKDHPALFGYKVQDEPIQKMNTDEELGRAYTTIRNIDPHHPIYLDDSGEGSYKRLGRFCDIMDIDYYPGKGVNRASVISKKIAAGIEAVKGRKPVSLLQQAFINGGTFPTADEFRHYAYQTMFAGGSCVGYHSFGGEPGYMEPTSEEWAGLRAFAAWELDFMFDCFVNRKYPMLHEGEGGDVRWRTYVKDNKIYAFIINQAAQ